MKWFVKEGNRERALILREKHVKGERLLSAPSLLAYEVCNSLRYNPEFTEEDVKGAVKSLFELHLELNPPTIENMDKVSDNAFKYNISAYDAAYLSLAESERCPFITADERLYEKLEENSLVVLLSSDKFYERKSERKFRWRRRAEATYTTRTTPCPRTSALGNMNESSN